MDPPTRPPPGAPEDGEDNDQFHDASPARTPSPRPPLLRSHAVVEPRVAQCSACRSRFQFEPEGPPPPDGYRVECYVCSAPNTVPVEAPEKRANGKARKRTGTDEDPLETDLYDTLNVSPAASAGEIKKSYYFLAQKHHPDKNPGDPHAEEVFKKVSRAYQVLSDPQLRSAYNRYGAAAFAPGGGEDTEAAAAAIFADPVEFFRGQFGGEAFIDIIGDIAIAKDFGDALNKSVASKSGSDAKSEDEAEKKQKREEEHAARVKRLSEKLSGRLERYVSAFPLPAEGEDAAEHLSRHAEEERQAMEEFRKWFSKEAGELRKENFGVELLHALGTMYRLQARQHLVQLDVETGGIGRRIWGFGARFMGGLREKRHLLSETYSTVKVAYELQASFSKLQELEERKKAREAGEDGEPREPPKPKKGEKELTPEEEAELTRKLEMEAATKGMEALWLGSKLELLSVIKEVCEVVAGDQERGREVRRRRCVALDALGEIYESTKPE
ncbi:X-domain of DnaJ-containing-domain-containing protein [Hyaloraphidium curvatum]|nr:X-domain of DnaJ-containing-domain-containing protein [Hyaloraphidium curvatum]